jgi:hypothetical protein
MITIYTITYNEELLIDFFINHYRKNFPNCKIVIYDNESTDNTVKIAKNQNCEIITYSTNNQLLDSRYLEIKNNCWKLSKTEWVIVCDCDELINISQEELKNESFNGVNIIKPKGYSMVGFNDDLNLDNIKYGFRDFGYDKTILFNKNQIKEINYSIGCHNSNPEPQKDSIVVYNKKEYKLLHYKYLSEKYIKDKHKNYFQRLSEENKQKNWGIHYINENIVNNHLENGKQNLELLK